MEVYNKLTEDNTTIQMINYSAICSYCFNKRFNAIQFDFLKILENTLYCVRRYLVRLNLPPSNFVAISIATIHAF